MRLLTTNDSGQALAEFALVLPILLVLLFAMLDFGKAFNYWIDATHISAEGARFAVVNRKPDPASGLSLQEQLRDQSNTDELRSGGTPSIASPSQVCVDFPNGTSKPGDPVRVRMSFTYDWLPFLGSQTGLTQTTIDSTATMRLEAVPTNYGAGCA
ncbi:MAG: pilus assembly protein [Actinomycetota bacterium]|nr:pilus assembly protein [Actinomycetota bacterium]